MTRARWFLLGLAAVGATGVFVAVRSLVADVRRAHGKAAEHQTARGGRIDAP